MTWTFRNFDTTVFLKLFSRAIFKKNLNLPRFFDHTEIIYSIDYSIYIFISFHDKRTERERIIDLRQEDKKRKKGRVAASSTS